MRRKKNAQTQNKLPHQPTASRYPSCLRFLFPPNFSDHGAKPIRWASISAPQCWCLKHGVFLSSGPRVGGGGGLSRGVDRFDARGVSLVCDRLTDNGRVFGCKLGVSHSYSPPLFPFLPLTISIRKFPASNIDLTAFWRQMLKIRGRYFWEKQTRLVSDGGKKTRWAWWLPPNPLNIRTPPFRSYFIWQMPCQRSPKRRSRGPTPSHSSTTPDPFWLAPP